ncbi:hypothetical protein WICANDRAFT_26971 [Wickerhamomyces anomalus NRRL Y-366-8]|uniref:Vacuolar protein sorting-associated protein 17 n=1 Tax=Wickerhamomyces anomalus (strain ATCC 58044 / CBS 1984 / NCYC 433 / NRRL Y-366-8) TaxID=683960 RepID=A0A1E3PAF1_WICAA|nr:uncharacterized protein WICANDRAFT_26971 [Wickerhamomyces anomalus NRRL Y-366-8]ODQ62371.1 hypothetical protein WICANDRAFT_26971 [Wickerhamomyces anomalus NRRL Y-366-8]
MSSSIPYDPDEFDNNPFSEPAPLQQDQEAEHSPYAQDEEQPESEQPEVDQPASAQEDQPTQKINAAESLVPERFDKKHDYKIVIKVQAIERVGTLSNKKENPSILFDVSTNLPHFRKKNYKGVKKSYQEFESFFKFLNGANPECFIPSLPLSSTNYGIQNEEDYRKTIFNFQTWFNRITSNPIIIRNEEFVFFIESDHNSYSPIHKSKVPASGLRRKTLKQFQPPYDEVLELAEFRPLIKSIYKTTTNIHTKLEKLSKLRKSMAVSENEMGNQIVELNVLENSHPGMQNMWKKFGKTITILGDLESVIGSLDLATLGDGLESVINDGYTIKEALTNRHLLMRDLVTAQSNTKLKHENARKLRNKRDINPIKVDEAIRSLQEATNYEEELTLKIKRITENMLIEKKEYLEYLDILIKQILKEFVIKRIEYERKKLSILEKVRLDVRLVDENGGLSRLGREKYPLKKSVHTPSQGPEGDSWSGDRKVSHFSEELLKEDQEQDAELPIEEDEQVESEEDVAIDARNAASLLGGSTF